MAGASCLTPVPVERCRHYWNSVRFVAKRTVVWQLTIMPFSRLLFLVCSVLALSTAVGAQNQPRQDRAWKHYVDKQAGYCISYPSRWIRGDRSENGLYFTTGVTRYSTPIALLDVSTTADDTSLSSAVPVSLTTDYQSHVEGLEKFIRVNGVQTLDQRKLTVGGQPALFTRAQYADPKEKSNWMEAIVLLHREHMLYRLELQSQARSWSRFEPVFQHFVDSFQTDCGTH